MTKHLPVETFKQNEEKLLNSEISNESLIIEVYDDQNQRENVKRHVLGIVILAGQEFYGVL